MAWIYQRHSDKEGEHVIFSVKEATTSPIDLFSDHQPSDPQAGRAKCHGQKSGKKRQARSQQLLFTLCSKLTNKENIIGVGSMESEHVLNGIQLKSAGCCCCCFALQVFLTHYKSAVLHSKLWALHWVLSPSAHSQYLISCIPSRMHQFPPPSPDGPVSPPWTFMQHVWPIGAIIAHSTADCYMDEHRALLFHTICSSHWYHAIQRPDVRGSNVFVCVFRRSRQ